MDFLGSVVNNSVTNPAEKQLRPVLCDENIQVLSTFELNQVASLTYNDVTRDGIFEFIGTICSQPLDFTPLTIQKALIVVKHIVVYGSEKTVNHAYGLQGRIQPLLEFNTVLMAQKQGGAMSFFQTLQGGAVDKGGPIREAAGKLLHLLGNIEELRRLRLASASENSLVPIGDNGQVAFITDEVRLQILKRKMAEDNRVRVQSNLKKSEGGFGGGYASKDGRSVVGAAHGIEEMIKMANIHQKKHQKVFSDEGGAREKTREEIILEELKAEADAEKAKRAEKERAEAARVAASPSVDLLGSYATSAPPAATSRVGDLLDFGGPSAGGGPTTATSTGDLLGGGLPATNHNTQTTSADPFGLASAYNTQPTATQQPTAPVSNHPAATSLLDFSVQNDPFAPVSETANRSIPNDGMGLMSMTMNSMSQNATITAVNTTSGIGTASGAMNDLSSGLTSLSLNPSMQSPPPLPTAPTPTPAMGPPSAVGSTQDRFSALDALAATPAPIPARDTAQDAEARILGLGFGGLASTSSSGITAASTATTVSMGASTSISMGSSGLSDYPAAPPPAALPPMMMHGSAPGTIPDPMVAPGSGRVATAYGDGMANAGLSNDDDDDNPWVMGGNTGMGLEPVGPVPSAPPPPPPPTYY